MNLIYSEQVSLHSSDCDVQIIETPVQIQRRSRPSSPNNRFKNSYSDIDMKFKESITFGERIGDDITLDIYTKKYIDTDTRDISI